MLVCSRIPTEGQDTSSTVGKEGTCSKGRSVQRTDHAEMWSHVESWGFCLRAVESQWGSELGADVQYLTF